MGSLIWVLTMAGKLWRYQLKALFKGIKYVSKIILIWVAGGPNSDLELGLYFSKLLLKLTILGTRKSVKKFWLKYGYKYSTTTIQNELKYSICLACKMDWADHKKGLPQFFLSLKDQYWGLKHYTAYNIFNYKSSKLPLLGLKIWAKSKNYMPVNLSYLTIPLSGS